MNIRNPMTMLSSIISTLKSIFENVIVSLITDEIKERRKFLPSLLSTLLPKKKLYFLQLNSILKEMPFIYGDYYSEVLTDFQEVNMRIVALNENNNLLIEKEQEKNLRKVYSLFNEVNKVIIFGSAGMGKSTFVRHVTMSLINKIPTFYLTKQHIPLFIQLKAKHGTIANIKVYFNSNSYF